MTAKPEANRRNAKRSTGPRTVEGKAIVSRNPIKHGLLSAEAMLPDDDLAIFEAFESGLRAELAPVGELEGLMADRVVACAWRLRRALRVESEILQADRYNHYDEDRGVGFAFSRNGKNFERFATLNRYEVAIERSMYRALHELQRLQAARSGEAVPLPMVMDVDVAVSRPDADE